MSAAVDTSLVREIEQDQTKMVWLLLGAILFVAGGYWLVTGDFSNTPRGALAPYAGWASIVFFGAGGLFVIYRLIRPELPLTLSPRGIRTARMQEFLPWANVTTVTEQQAAKQKFVALAYYPVVAANGTANRSGFEQLLSGMAPARISISAGTLKISHNELLQLVTAYAAAHRHNFPTTTPNAAPTNRPASFGRRHARQ